MTIWDELEYRQRVRKRAKELGSDGCTGVPDWYLFCCQEHDIAYRTHETVDGVAVSRPVADAQLRRCTQRDSKFGRWSPMSYWRWFGVRLFGWRAWNAH